MCPPKVSQCNVCLLLANHCLFDLLSQLYGTLDAHADNASMTYSPGYEFTISVSLCSVAGALKMRIECVVLRAGAVSGDAPNHAVCS